MRTVDRRLRKLEEQYGIAHSATRYLIIHIEAGRELGPAEDTYIEILDEAGFLHTAGFGLVDLTQIPDGLNLEEGTRFVRQNGARICGSRSAQSPCGTGIEDEGNSLAQSVEITLAES